jgi:hypothetical protein
MCRNILLQVGSISAILMTRKILQTIHHEAEMCHFGGVSMDIFDCHKLKALILQSQGRI